MKIGIIDSSRNCYVNDASIEAAIFAHRADVDLFRVASSVELPAAVLECDGLISWHLVPLDRAVFERLTRCRAIVRAAVGFDNIDLAAAREKAISVANVPDYGTEEVADHTLAMALSLLRRLPRGNRVVTHGSWDWREVGGLPRIGQLRIGLIGCGRIGTAVVRRFQSFGCDVCVYDPYLRSGMEKALGVTRAEHLDALLERSDLVTIHAPLTSETRHLIGAAQLQQLQGKYLVNTARGAIIDGQALREAVGRNALRGVALDVFENEAQAIPEEFRDRDDVILSPHVAFYSDEALPELREKAARVLLDILTTGGHRNVIQ